MPHEMHAIDDASKVKQDEEEFASESDQREFCKIGFLLRSVRWRGHVPFGLASFEAGKAVPTKIKLGGNDMSGRTWHGRRMKENRELQETGEG
jgi:hypothetical protein